MKKVTYIYIPRNGDRENTDKQSDKQVHTHTHIDGVNIIAKQKLISKKRQTSRDKETNRQKQGNRKIEAEVEAGLRQRHIRDRDRPRKSPTRISADWQAYTQKCE